MAKETAVSNAVKNLQVDKAAFDAALKKLIATPPIRRARLPKTKPWAGIPPDRRKRPR